MQKQKRWQLALIITVLSLTVYNILPTVFFYTKPLKKAISEKQAEKITALLSDRVNRLEQETLDWVKSYCHLLGVKPLSIKLEQNAPQNVNIQFSSNKEAALFKKNFDRAGALIPFAPAQLSLSRHPDEASKNPTVTVARKIPLHFHKNELGSIFQYSLKKDAEGRPSKLYQALIEDRALELAVNLAGPSQSALYAQSIINSNQDPLAEDLALSLAQNILSFKEAFGEGSLISKRYYASFLQIENKNPSEFIQLFANRLEAIKNKSHIEKIALEEESKNVKNQGQELSYFKQQRLKTLAYKEAILSSALNTIDKNRADFTRTQKPFNYTTAALEIQKTISNAFPEQVISLEEKNPFVSSLIIDWQNDKIRLKLHAELEEILANLENKTESKASDKIHSLLFSEIAYLTRLSGEEIIPYKGQFEIALSDLDDSKSFIAMRLDSVAKTQLSQLQNNLKTTWEPKSVDLQRDVYPFFDWESYLNAPRQQQQLSLVFFAPATYNKLPPQGFRMSSLYIIAKGFDKILQKYEQDPNSEESKKFFNDFNALQQALQKQGFVGYSGKSYAIASEFSSDFIFEARDYYQSILGATRENFQVHGTKRYAILEFSNLEQRILAENKIDTAIHEDLLKWRDDYQAAKLLTRGLHYYDSPKPTHNVFFSNLALSIHKYFRGDDKKILRWGLDLSGGKTVQLELRDANHKLVTNPDELRQGINELYARVNKMGVSEVSIRQEGNYITLDFPGSQSMSASELVKASSMYFHVVNEKFSRINPTLSYAVDRFLQEVWDEAVISNRKSEEQINAIAFKHLYGNAPASGNINPISESAKNLYDNGLRLANQDDTQSANFDLTFSKIAVLRGKDAKDWQGQTHPLCIVFKNYALEGSQMEAVRASYDPSKGSFLNFSIKGSYITKTGIKIDPQASLWTWTSAFSKEKIAGTSNETYSHGRGWRMAVILNGNVISAPTLDSALKDQASITGSFTQREINQLESDLKAGSLTYSPYIISEKNVSPELGQQERLNGISATMIALGLVIIVMMVYYKFGGLIASIAVLLNLLIMWGTLVNIGATLTLSNLAGLILTVGMAVDANVLVFERIREEFALSQKISQAVHAGYKKAFSAIIDSNLTTIIAGLILLNFDSGPIKGFALTLIIGIFSSMFTALFLTRFFFFSWVKNPKNTALKMASWIRPSSFSFLKYSKPTLIVSTVVILLGSVFLVKNSNDILGMDFKGGYALNLELPIESGEQYREKVEAALLKSGVSSQEMQLRELSPSNNVKIFLSRALDQKGKPFYGMPQVLNEESLTYPYQADPRLSWLVSQLQDQKIQLSESTLQSLDKNWTLVSGQMSDKMRNNAVIGLALALACILVYITFRFELNYAISATLCLAHDLIFTVAAMAALHAIGIPIQIDLNTIAALMTIVGYSLNDTIIVFDRIREDIRLHKKMPLSQVIELSLNATLSRTLLTSGTTLLVLIPMIILGGSTIFGFALVMAIGVVFGTLSSLFIAAPLMQYFANRKDIVTTIDVGNQATFK